MISNQQKNFIQRHNYCSQQLPRSVILYLHSTQLNIQKKVFIKWRFQYSCVRTFFNFLYFLLTAEGILLSCRNVLEISQLAVSFPLYIPVLKVEHVRHTSNKFYVDRQWYCFGSTYQLLIHRFSFCCIIKENELKFVAADGLSQ